MWGLKALAKYDADKEAETCVGKSEDYSNIFVLYVESKITRLI